MASSKNNMFQDLPRFKFKKCTLDYEKIINAKLNNILQDLNAFNILDNYYKIIVEISLSNSDDLIYIDLELLKRLKKIINKNIDFNLAYKIYKMCDTDDFNYCKLKDITFII